MATLQARFMLIAFIAMAVAITYNATFLQTGPHPAPMSADAHGGASAVPKKAARQQRKLPRTLLSPIETTASLPKSKTVLAIQRQLAQRGYDPGPTDGVLGDNTRAAIMAYEHDNKRPVTGEASDALLRSMILGASPEDSNRKAPNRIPPATTALITSIQLTLDKLGYDPGPVDGVWGTSTQNAIRKFESDRKIPEKGRISGRLLNELIDANGGQLMAPEQG